MRDRLWGAAVGTLAAIISTTFALWLSGAVANAQANKKKFDDKVDVVDFDKYKLDTNERLNQIQAESEKNLTNFKEHVDKRIDDTQTLIVELNRANNN